jgi:hypothetical protein
VDPEVVDNPEKPPEEPPEGRTRGRREGEISSPEYWVPYPPEPRRECCGILSDVFLLNFLRFGSEEVIKSFRWRGWLKKINYFLQRQQPGQKKNTWETKNSVSLSAENLHRNFLFGGCEKGLADVEAGVI